MWFPTWTFFTLADETTVEEERFTVPLYASHDLALGPQSVIRFLFRSDLQSISDAFVFTGGVAWHRGSDRFRFALGVVATNFAIIDVEDILAAFNWEPELPAVYPLPYIRMWWRF